MAHPFGGHPTLERFVEFATELGCTFEIKVRVRADGSAYRVLEITNTKNGNTVVMANPDMAEYLAPSQVAYFQRRLAIKTPFASTPEAPTEKS